ncbi:MAG: alpha/beta fold hydrolase [Planctomycetota bacterium]|jgi:dienelactone hydrolase
MKEEVLLIGKRPSMVGIITDPPEAKRGHDFPVIILLNAGILHRVGPSRLYVKMARELASRGFAVLRIDFSGIGDSAARNDDLPFEEKWVNEVREVMDFLAETRGAGRFVLMGICSGAEFSFKTACVDSRVAGAVLINPQAHLHDSSNEELNSYIHKRVIVRHNWRIALFSSFLIKKWLKAIRGEVDYRSVTRLIGFQLKNLFTRNHNVSTEVNNVVKDFTLLKERGVRLLHVYSEGDTGLDYLHLILGDKIEELSASGRLRVEVIPGSNHTFTLISNQAMLSKVIRKWALKTVQNRI